MIGEQPRDSSDIEDREALNMAVDRFADLINTAMGYDSLSDVPRGEMVMKSIDLDTQKQDQNKLSSLDPHVESIAFGRKDGDDDDGMLNEAHYCIQLKQNGGYLGDIEEVEYYPLGAELYVRVDVDTDTGPEVDLLLPSHQEDAIRLNGSTAAQYIDNFCGGVEVLLQHYR